MNREKAWIWFKGGIEGGSWIGGFYATKTHEDGYIVERSDFKKCRLPDWRVKLKEPEDKNIEPIIPEKAIWKYP